MSEFTPPSYSGDPNSARCEQECLTLGFISLNAAVLMKCLGGSRLLLDARPRMNGDLALAMAEEADNKKRRKKGLPEINRREKLGATQFMWQQRWQEYYRARNGIWWKWNRKWQERREEEEEEEEEECARDASKKVVHQVISSRNNYIINTNY